MKTLVAQHGPIQVPFEVDREVRRKMAGVGESARYRWLISQGHIVVLDEVTIVGKYAAVAAIVTDLLPDWDPVDSDGFDQDLGEASTVGHARVLLDQGIDACAYIDDRKGRSWGAQYDVPMIDTVSLFEDAINLGLITTKQDLTTKYARLARHSRVPALHPTRLPGLLP